MSSIRHVPAPRHILERPFYSATLLVGVLAVSLACSLTGLVNSSPPGGGAEKTLVIIAPPDSTATPTPFQPLPPTPTYLPTDMPTPTMAPTEEDPLIALATTQAQIIQKSWEDYPGPTIWPDIDVPAPMGVLPQPEGQVNILLLGSDQRPDDYGFRTDTVQLLTLNSSLGTVNVTSFPRDLYVYIPGYTVQRINTAFAYGGFESLALTFEYNFGVYPDYYVLINLWSFSEIVDNLGGIDVHVGVTMTDHRDSYGDYTVNAGTVHMDGETTLWYVRARYTTDDFDRGRRQQEVLEALGLKLLSLDAVAHISDFYTTYRKSVTTDLTLDDILAWVPLATQLSDTSRIHRYQIGTKQVYNWITYAGAMVLVPIRESVLEVMRKALNSP